ncbi:MAG: Rqc2 family fibronectin-binding protein [Nitrospirota bacterium]
MVEYALMDISVFKAVISELNLCLPGRKLTEIAESRAGEFFLVFRGEGSKTLLISPRPQAPRMHLFPRKPRDLRELTPIGQGLANLFLSSRLLSIQQDGMERAVRFNFIRKSGKNEVRATLVFEMAGKKPELIALDGEGKILLAQSYSALEEGATGARAILPGLRYESPPVPDKLSPDNITAEYITEIFRNSPGIPVDRALFENIGGLSPLLAREVATVGNDDPQRLLEALKNLLCRLDSCDFAPRIYETGKGPVLAVGLLLQFGDAPFREFSSMNEAAETFYGEAEARREFQSAKTGLLRKVRAELAGARKKAEAIEADISKAEKADQYRLSGQTLMASLNQVPKRASEVFLTDYATGDVIEIPLDPKLGAVENAEEYFKKAKKARSGEKLLRERLEGVRAGIETFEARLEALEEAKEIIELLSFLPEQKVPGRHKVVKNAPPEFPSFATSDGYSVLIGKNSKMNDLLTFKAAQPMDLWLHAQGYRGSHVIVRNPARRPDIPLATILQAAEAAAYYSGGKKERSVPVDYTFVKYVRKMKDGPPGAVIFTGNKTVFVEPKKR